MTHRLLQEILDDPEQRRLLLEDEVEFLALEKAAVAEKPPAREQLSEG